MKTKLANLWRALVHHLPECLLGLFVLALLPSALLLVTALREQAGVLLDSPSAYGQGLLQRPWAAASVLTCVVGTLVLIALMWRNWTFVWATARKMIIEALHRRIVLVLLVFFVVLMLLLPFVLKTEGSLRSQVQLVMLYSLVLALVLLSMVAIFLSAASICSEVEHKHVQVTDTKPMRRWQFLLGKWFGVVVLCTAVMFVMTGASLVLILYLARPPDLARMGGREAARAGLDYQALVDQVLVARRVVKATEPPGVDKAVEAQVEQAKAAGLWPESTRKQRNMREQIRFSLLTQMMTVPPGGRYTWVFEGLRPDDQGVLQVHFLGHVSTPKGDMVGRWLVLKEEKTVDETGKEQRKFRVVETVVPPPAGWRAGSRPTITISAEAIGQDGTLYLTYENYHSYGAAIFSGKELTAALQREGSFIPNYYRSVLIMLCHVALLAALGLMAGSLFSFPVASLLVVFCFLVGVSGPWFLSFVKPSWFWYVEMGPVEEIVRTAWYDALAGFLAVMPHFGQHNPLGKLTEGVMVGWGQVMSAGAVMVYLKAAAALLIGMYFYSRRELARVIV